MIKEIVNALFVPAGSSSIQYSQAFALGNDNNVTADVLLISATSGSTSATVYFQVSDEMENWAAVASASVGFAAGGAPRKATLTVTDVVSAYGRFKFKANTGDALFKVSAFTKRT